MISTRVVTISGEDYEITQLGGRKGLEVMAELTQVAGPSVVAMFDQAGLDVGSVTTEALVSAVQTLCARALAKEITHFWDVFSEKTTSVKNGVKIPMSPAVADQMFAGRTQDMLALLWAHLEFNFSGFRNAVASWIAAAMQKAGEASQSPRS